MMQRMWINQPSTAQPCYHYHGKNVLADMKGELTTRVWFTEGDVISVQIPTLCLSKGWLEKVNTTVARSVRDIPKDFHLVQNTLEINEILENLGLEVDHSDYGCLFVKWSNSEISEVYGCYQDVAYLACPVDKLL